MEKKQKITMIYGFAVCMVCVITFIISFASILEGIVNMSDPVHAGSTWNYPAQLVSFDAYKMSVFNESENKASISLDDQTIKAMYDSSLSDMVQSRLHHARRGVIVSGLLLILSSIFFAIHWIWMKKLIRK